MAADVRRTRRVALLILGMVVLVAGAVRIQHNAASNTEATTSTSEPTPRFEFIESNGVGLPAEGRGPDYDRAFITVPVVNHGSTARVTKVRPIGEPGLVVEYFGYSDCRRGGCPMAVRADPDELRMAHQAVMGTIPLVLQRDYPTALIFTLKVTPEGLATFAKRCLRLRSVELTLADHSRHIVTAGDGESLGSVQRVPPPPGYPECDLH